MAGTAATRIFSMPGWLGCAAAGVADPAGSASGVRAADAGDARRDSSHRRAPGGELAGFARAAGGDSGGDLSSVWPILSGWVAAGEPCVLGTLVSGRVSGGGPGSKLAIRSDGEVAGDFPRAVLD